MADPVVPPIPKKIYGSRLSLDLDSPSPDFKPDGCASLTNIIRRKNRAFAKRPGAKIAIGAELTETAAADYYVGLHSYVYKNSNYGDTKELLAISGGDNPRIYVKRTESVTITGTGSFVSILSTGSAWQVNLKASNGTNVTGWPKTYGNGLAAASGTLATLETDIDATVGYTCTVSSANKAYTTVGQLGSMKETVIPVGGLVIYYETTSSPIQAPTLTIQNAGPDSDYQNLKGVTYANCMMFPMGRRMPLCKYDGLLACRPGLPRGILSAITETGTGPFNAGESYIYRIVFWRVDNRANQIYGPYSDDSLAIASYTVLAASKNIQLDFMPMTRSELDSYAGLQWDPRAAQVNGAQAGVTTVTVDSGHSLQIGDQVFIYDSGTGTTYERTLTGRGATTVTFVGAVTVSDNDVISNIRVQIQRTTDAGLDFFEVANIPNNATLGASTAQTFIDGISDANLGDDIEEQQKLPEPPLAAKFLCMHQGLLILLNLEDDPSGFAWNDPNWGFEAFPQASNRDQVTGGEGGQITGGISSSDGTLLIFKERSYFRVEGDLQAGQYTITEVNSNGLGVTSHASLVKLPKFIMGMSLEGPVLITETEISIEISRGILNLFKDIQYEVAQGSAIATADTARLVPARSTAAYWREQGLVLFFVPAETGTYVAPTSTPTISRYANDESVWLCYDIEKNEWRDWSFYSPFFINAHLAMLTHGKELYFVSSAKYPASGSGSISPNYIFKFNDPEKLTSYVDNVDPITFRMLLQWENFGFPSNDKKMTYLKIYTQLEDFVLNNITGKAIGSGPVSRSYAHFRLLIREYRNEDSASSPTAYTNTRRDFYPRSSAIEKGTTAAIVDPVVGDFISNQIELVDENEYYCPVIASLEMGYKVMTSPEAKDIKGRGLQAENIGEDL